MASNLLGMASNVLVMASIVVVNGIEKDFAFDICFTLHVGMTMCRPGWICGPASSRTTIV